MTRPFCALAALLATFVAGMALAEQAEWLQSYVWKQDNPDFGGFSGIELGANGIEMIAITDRGNLAIGRVQRDAGQIVGIDARLQPTPDTHRDHVIGPESDSEGLALGDDGFSVSFEGRNRINHYGTDLTVTRIPSHPLFQQMAFNGGIEALAVDAAGALYAIPERSGHPRRTFPVWRFADGAWDQPFAITRSQGFLPVGSDFGPDGRFYLLERGFNGFGFRSRVRVFTPKGDRLADEATLLITSTGRHDNLEGISVWTDAAGRIRLTLISDDNFVGFQRTEIVEYAVTQALASRASTP